MWTFGGGGFGDIAWVPGPNLPHPKGIRDPQDWIIAHKTNPEYISGIFELPVRGRRWRTLRLVWQAVGSKIDVVLCQRHRFRHAGPPLHLPGRCTAPCTSHSTSASNDWIQQNTTWKVFFHTCGSIVDLLDDLVDVGVDIVNPVQCSAKGMERRGAQAAATASSLVFWGGGVDTQWTLPFGTPDEVYSAGARAYSHLQCLAAASFSTPSTTSNRTCRSTTCWPWCAPWRQPRLGGAALPSVT